MSTEAIKYRCTECLASVAVTPMNKYRKHPPKSDDPCRMSGQRVPVRIIMGGADTGDDRPVKGRDYDQCPGCSRMPKLDVDGAFKEHAETKGSDELCMFSGKLPSGKKPTPEIPGATQYAEKLQEAAPQTEPCPQEGCGRIPTIQPDGTFIAHMQKDWGQTPCPMSGKSVNATQGQSESVISVESVASESPTLFPSEVFKNGEQTPQRPARMATLELPGPLPEIQALADVFPKSARIPVSTSTESAAPKSAGAPDTDTATIPIGTDSASPVIADIAQETLSGYRNAAATIAAAAYRDALNGATTRSAPIRHEVPIGNEPPIPRDRLKLVKCSCGAYLYDGAPHDVECITTLEELPRLCYRCGIEMGGYHDCPAVKFVRPDPVPDDNASQFVPAGDVPAPLRPLDMSTEAQQLVARMKEIFYAYSNRMDRSVQETLGPSEIGTPCDRRLAMSIMRIPSVNPGGDNWASFVGTCVHAGLAEMFLWADANQGRFAVEQRVEYPNALVPKGTADLLDRMILMVDDHKLMGRWSLDKLRLEGIKPLYLVQLMLYAYGLILKGEKVKKVALIGWPREQSTLNDLTAVVLPYDESIALEALARVDRIAAEVEEAQTRTDLSPLRIARGFSVQDDCTYCPFFAKGDSEMTRGCNGRK